MVHFPGLAIDLHIFEPRYRNLVADLIERPESQRLLALPNVPQHQPESGYRRRATLARLSYSEPLDDDRWLIRAIGLAAIQIGDEVAGRPYRRAHCSILEEATTVSTRQVSRFEEAFSAVAAETSLMTEDDPGTAAPVPQVVRRVNEVCSRSGLPPSSRQELLELPWGERFELTLELLERQREVLALLRPHRQLSQRPELN